MKRFLKIYSIAFESLTIFHAGWNKSVENSERIRSVVFYPVVGLFLGVILNLSRLFFQVLLPKDAADFLTIILLVVFTGGIHLTNLACGPEILGVNNSEGDQASISTGGLSFVSAGIIIFIQWGKFFVLTCVPLTLESQAVVLLPMVGLWVMMWTIYISPSETKSPEGFPDTVSWREFFPASIVALVFLFVFLKLKAFPVVFMMIGSSFAFIKLGGYRRESAFALGASHELGGIIFLFCLGFINST